MAMATFLKRCAELNVIRTFTDSYICQNKVCQRAIKTRAMRRSYASDLDSALESGFALVKTICDDADAWGERKLGHHYVRINNKTIEIRYECIIPSR